MKFVIGFVLGVTVATVGFNGIASILDGGVTTIKTQARTLSKNGQIEESK
jgi:hypothetical protein